MSETISIQEVGMSNEVHLCKSCCHEQPICQPDHIILGDGKGGDNMCACNLYDPVELRHPKWDGHGDI